MHHTHHTLTPELETLTRLFYDNPADLGEFSEVTAGDLDQGYCQLLAHNAHMTVTVEAFHGSAVNVRVLDRRLTATHYARKILLARSSDQAVVQFGIMRINLAYLEPRVADEIRREQTPLGRVLIQHNVLTNVQLFGLWRVIAARELAGYFSEPPGVTTFGRTALIHCNGAAAVELLEIVAPLRANAAPRTGT